MMSAQYVGAARCLTSLAVAAVLAASAPASRALDAREAEPALRGISSRVNGDFTTVRIEASDPVAYVTSRPDALTVLVDLRNVRVPASAKALRRGWPAGADRVPASMTPIDDVVIERTTESDGTPGVRVRISLSRAAEHRVRSARNLIFVEVQRTPLGDVATSRGTAEGVPSTSRRDRIAPQLEGTALAVPTANSEGTASAAPTHQQPAVPPEPPPPPSPLQEPAPGQPRRFTGHSVSLDFQGADLRSVLRTFAEISGLNIVLDPSIGACTPSGAGCVDLALRDVPWDQALDIILRANKLGYTVDGTIVRIAPLTVLAQEEEERRKFAEAQAQAQMEAGERGLKTYTLSYAKAPDLVPILRASALSRYGDVQIDLRTNTLVVRDLADHFAAIEEVIGSLDKPERQVEIEARIVRVQRTYSKELGIQWGAQGRMSPDLGNTTGLAFPNSGSVQGRTGNTQGPSEIPTVVNAPTQGAPTGAIGLALGSVNGAFNLDVALQALEKQGKLRLLSSPRVSTQNNVEAEITQGRQIPIQTVANNTISVTFKDAALTLRVKPQITASNTVILNINLEKSAADFSLSVNGIPPIDTQRAITNVLLDNGETTVIGGIFESTQTTGQDGVPYLSRVPILGWLFRNERQSDIQDEVMIFITPRIIEY